ncbi:unnamed protein product, partial [Adineta ricciae]
MRRTMESVAAERLNKLGKNPSIISTRHDLKRDAAVLKDIIDRNTPIPSSDECSTTDEENSLDESQSSLSIKHLQNSKEKLNKRKNCSSDDQTFKKLSRLFLAAPTTSIQNCTTNETRQQIHKSPSTPWSLFKKTGSPSPSLPNPP